MRDSCLALFRTFQTGYKTCDFRQPMRLQIRLLVKHMFARSPILEIFLRFLKNVFVYLVGMVEYKRAWRG